MEMAAVQELRKLTAAVPDAVTRRKAQQDLLGVEETVQTLRETSLGQDALRAELRSKNRSVLRCVLLTLVQWLILMRWSL